MKKEKSPYELILECIKYWSRRCFKYFTYTRDYKGNKMIKEKDFIDWFSENIGYGYGTGEQYTIPALKGFLEICLKSGNLYNHEWIEEKIGKAETWFLMNILCDTDIVEYGTSPRNGWLTEKGLLLAEFISKHTVDELYKMVMTDSDFVHCTSEYCNCGVNGYEEGKKCNNPLF